MGAIYSRLSSPLPLYSGSQSNRGRKRKHEEIDTDSSDDTSTVIEKSLNTPFKKKLLTTPQYIYKTFFVEEQNSDVSVMALGKIWHLHKIYLCQSPYFSSMFNGSWREHGQNFIRIEIIDPRITLESLNVVFGSLYLDEVILDPKTVVSVLAASTLFQLDGLLEKCCEVMNSTINAETAIFYYEAALQYGTINVKKNAFDWLLTNLLTFYSRHYKWLRLINVDLLSELIESPELVVMQTEFALYALLKVWMYLKIHSNNERNVLNEHNTNEVLNQVSNYFANLNNRTAFLHTAIGKQFLKPFMGLRLQHLVNHPLDIKTILEDNIMPQEWLYGPSMSQWHSLIKIDNCLDKGPVDCDENTFYKSCLRCGRVLEDDGYQKWRWTGFNFGIDLVMVSDMRTLSIKRHHRTENERLLSLQSKRNIMIRVTIISLNEQRQVKHSQSTGVKLKQLDRNEESGLLYIDTEHVYPILVSVNLLVNTPNKLPIPLTPVDNTSIPSTSSGQTQYSDNTLDSNSNESEISTIGTMKTTATDNSLVIDNS